MDQHPIPQDVTGFQFKLIGSMTVKQFGYVTAGAISAVILYYMPLNFPLSILIKILLIPALGSSGAVVAFLPIEGRPVDVMASNFFKAVLSPNQYIYIKRGRKLSFLTITTHGSTGSGTSNTLSAVRQKKTDELVMAKEQRLEALLHGSQGRPKNKLDEREGAYLKLFSMPQPMPVPMPVKTAPQTVVQPATPPSFSLPPAPTPSPVPAIAAIPPKPVTAPIPTAASLDKEETDLARQILQAKREEHNQHAPESIAASHQKVLTLEKELTHVRSEKEQLEQELVALRSQLNTPQAQIAPPPPSPSLQKKAGMPYIPDTPNVLVGIVRDPRGNVLPSILVEVKDKNGNPVRAFKTNALGQFASATPVAPGIYTIELEDPKKQQLFEKVQISVNNQILMPIEIVSHDAREELRKQLFN
jgi:hypothetical protein